jgi:hypothetical protein
VDVAALWAKVTRTHEAIDATEVARAAAVLATETSAQEAIAVWDGTTLCIKDAED